MTSKATAHPSPLGGAFPRLVGVGVIALAAFVLIGWGFNLPALAVLANVAVFSGFALCCAAALYRSAQAWQTAVEDLRQNEQHYLALIESSHDAFTLHEPDGTVFYASPATRRVLGYLPAELVGRDPLTLVHPDDAEAFGTRMTRILAARGASASGEYRVRQKDGSYRWVEATASNLLADPNVEAVVTNLRDIEGRKRSEHEIAGYTQRLRLLRQIDRALISGVRPEEIAVGALPLLRDLLGVGRTIVNLFDLDKGEVEWLAAAGRKRVYARPGVRFTLQFMGDVAALKRGQPQMLDVSALPPGPEVDALRASGVTTYAVVPMIARGELIGALSFGGSSAPVSGEQIGIAQEVATQFAIALTQARLLERVQGQAEELESRVRERTAQLEAANRELEAFSYSVSHDLRAPLRAINGFSRILMDEHAERLPEAARDLLREVRDSAREMGLLVDGLLTFSRLSRQPIAAREVHPRELVDRCLDELREERAGREVDLTIGTLPECRGDPVLLKQVWVNLLSNALKYTRGRTPAQVEVGSQVDSATPAVTTYFVRDNGVGFDMRYADKLFGVFQRLHRAEEYEGTGVGLAIVQRIVQRHGGRIWAEARVGEGATFYFTLEGEP
jgi:PAS domain S-box-containing protein